VIVRRDDVSDTSMACFDTVALKNPVSGPIMGVRPITTRVFSLKTRFLAWVLCTHPPRELR